MEISHEKVPDSPTNRSPAPCAKPKPNGIGVQTVTAGQLGCWRSGIEFLDPVKNDLSKPHRFRDMERLAGIVANLRELAGTLVSHFVTDGSGADGTGRDRQSRVRIPLGLRIPR
jgi:hypothetical protein